MAELDHPLIEDYRQTCIACPDQYEGTLTDGRTFYYRYRSGRVRLGIGPDLDAAVLDCFRPGNWRWAGDELDGIFDSDEQANAWFRELIESHTPAKQLP